MEAGVTSRTGDRSGHRGRGGIFASVTEQGLQVADGLVVLGGLVAGAGAADGLLDLEEGLIQAFAFTFQRLLAVLVSE